MKEAVSILQEALLTESYHVVRQFKSICIFRRG